MKRFLSIFLCGVLLVAALSGCGKSKVAKVLINEELADSPLIAQLTEAFNTETGYTVELVTKNRTDVDAMVEKGEFDAALVITQNAAEKLQNGAYIGGRVFYDTMVLIGPKHDPASAAHLGGYAISDILKHLTLTGFTFVHPNLVTSLGMKDVSLWLKVEATPDAEQFVIAQDAGQQMIHLANEQGAYAITTRELWALNGEGEENLAVLLSGISGITDQYTVLAKPVEEGEDPSAAQAFCQWMVGQTARDIIVNYQTQDAAIPAYLSNIPEE